MRVGNLFRSNASKFPSSPVFRVLLHSPPSLSRGRQCSACRPQPSPVSTEVAIPSRYQACQNRTHFNGTLVKFHAGLNNVRLQNTVHLLLQRRVVAVREIPGFQGVFLGFKKGGASWHWQALWQCAHLTSDRRRNVGRSRESHSRHFCLAGSSSRGRQTYVLRCMTLTCAFMRGNHSHQSLRQRSGRPAHFRHRPMDHQEQVLLRGRALPSHRIRSLGSSIRSPRPCRHLRLGAWPGDLIRSLYIRLLSPLPCLPPPPPHTLAHRFILSRMQNTSSRCTTAYLASSPKWP